MTKRYAIFGGGMAGLTAAWKIMLEEPDAIVDLFEAGWRLGGKLHSTESEEDPENKEHGLHVLFGFYLNTFHVLHTCYQQIHDTPGLRFRQLDETVSMQKFGVIYDSDAPEEFRQWLVRWPIDNESLGTVTKIPGELLSIIDMMRSLLHIAESLLPENIRGSLDTLDDDALQLLRWMDDSRAFVDEFDPNEAHEQLKRHDQSDGNPGMEATAKAAALREQRPPSQSEVALERAQMLIDIGRGIVEGVYRLREKTGSWNLDVLDNMSLSDWLEANGVAPKAANSAFINMYREAAFGYRNGEEDKPDFAAGAALRALIRIFGHFRGCPTYKLDAGAGEVVIAPVFLAARRMGVRVNFFHRLEAIEWDEDSQTVKARLQQQARIKDGCEYEFLKLRSTGGVYWPETPDYDCLTNGEKLRAWSGRLDDPNQVVPDEVAPADAYVEIAAGPGAKYDKFIVATGLGPLKAPDSNGNKVFAQETERTEKFRATLDELQLVPTISAQFALDKTTEELGWVGDDVGPGLSGMPRPLSIAADMTTASHQKGMYYLCSAYPLAFHHLDPDAPDDAEVMKKIRGEIDDWCESSGRWLYSQPGSDFKWDWNILSCPDGATGVARMKTQYVRLNNIPAEGCIGCHSGTNQKLPGPEESGLPHVVLAGAWTRTGINLSSCEGAVMSGLRAARAATGKLFSVPGESFMSGEPRIEG